MEFDDAPAELTDEQVLAYMANSQLQPLRVQEALKEYKDKFYPKTYTFAQMNARYRAIKSNFVATQQHLRVQAADRANESEMLIKSNAVVYQVDSKEVTAEVRRGMLVENGQAVEVLKGVVSDALSYLYTPQTKHQVSSVVPSNFTNGVVKAGLPCIKSTTSVNPEEWKVTDAMVNSAGLYKQFADQRNLAKALGRVREALLTTGIPEKLLFTDHHGSPIPLSFAPQHPIINTEELSYRVLDVHRKMRGTDDRWLSPLTAGYYLFSMSRPMDRTAWETMDILGIVREQDVSSITVIGKTTLKMTTMQSLAAAGYPVFVRTDSLVRTPIPTNKDGTVPPGVYTQFYRDTIVFKTLLVYPPAANQIVVTNDKATPIKIDDKVEQHAQEFISLTKEHKYPSVTWTFLRNKLQEYPVTLRPSTHAHAMHVLMVMNSKIDYASWDLPTLFQRGVCANVYKTWFPLSRFRFLEADVRIFGFRNSAIFLGGLRIRMRPSITKKTMDYFGSLKMMELTVQKEDIAFELPVSFNLTVPVVQAVAPPVVLPQAPPQSPTITIAEETQKAEAVDTAPEEYDMFSDVQLGGI